MKKGIGKQQVKRIAQTAVGEIGVEPIAHLSKDAREAAEKLSEEEVLFLIDTYYSIQKMRLSTGGQISSMFQEKPISLLAWVHLTMDQIENEIKTWLDVYTESQYMGRWAKSVVGVGTVLAAGLLAYIDIRRCPTVGHIWAYGGLVPNPNWVSPQEAKNTIAQVMKGKKKLTQDIAKEVCHRLGKDPEKIIPTAQQLDKGKLSTTGLAKALSKRPFNQEFKTLCWKIADSFVKHKSTKGCIYGQLYELRKKYEEKNNLELKYKDQAEEKLRKSNINKNTEAYKWYSKGMLPPSRITLRAMRYAVKAFLSDYHYEAYKHAFGKEPPLPYPIRFLGHKDLKRGISWVED